MANRRDGTWESMTAEEIQRQIADLMETLRGGAFASGGFFTGGYARWGESGPETFFHAAPCEAFAPNGSYKENGAHLEGARDRCRRGETWRRYRPGGAYPFTQAGYLAVSEEPEVAVAAEEYRRAKRADPPFIGSDGKVVVGVLFLEAERKLRRRVTRALERAAAS